MVISILEMTTKETPLTMIRIRSTLLSIYVTQDAVVVKQTCHTLHSCHSVNCSVESNYIIHQPSRIVNRFLPIICNEGLKNEMQKMPESDSGR